MMTKYFLIIATPFAALLLMAQAAGNIRYSQIRSGDRTGTGPKLATSTGALTSGNCAKFNAAGDVIDAGSPCASSGSGGGLNLIETETASSSASLDFTSCISATYDIYVFQLVNVKPATNGAQLWTRMSTDGGSSYDASAIYGYTYHIFRAGADAATGVEGGATKGIISGQGISTSASWPGISGRIELYDPGSSSYYKLSTGRTIHFDGTYRIGTDYIGSYESVTAVNAVQFLMNTGNVASGTIRCYGVAK